MKFFTGKNYSTKNDAFGFPYVWIPFGKIGTVVGDSGNYQISEQELLIPESLDTIPGRNIYVGHEIVEIFNNQIPKENLPIPSGITTDIYRVSEDNLGYEVLSRISCPVVYEKLKNLELTESSPCYRKINGVRHYNHFGIFPPNNSRGGEKMKVILEGNHSLDLLSQDFLPGITLNLDSNIENQEFNLVNLHKKSIMEEQIGMLVANQSELTTKVDKIIEMMSQESKDDTVEMESTEIFQEGFVLGQVAGQIFAESISHGFVREENSSVEDAQKFVVAKAMPDLKLEGKTGEFLKGLYTGSLSILAKVKEEIKPEEKQKVVTPTLTVNDTITVKKISRYGKQQSA